MEAYAQGYEAGMGETPYYDNPYQDGTAEHFLWCKGWISGFVEVMDIED